MLKRRRQKQRNKKRLFKAAKRADKLRSQAAMTGGASASSG